MLSGTKQTVIFGLEKFFEETAFGVPGSSGNRGKVAEGSKTTERDYTTPK